MKGSWNECKKPEKLLENAIAKMILNENKVNNEKKIVEKNEQSTTFLNNDEQVKTIDNKNLTNDYTIIEKEFEASKDSKNINIDALQIDNEIVLKCLSDRFFFIFCEYFL